MNRRPQNDNDLVRAYYWHPCGQPAEHNVPAPNNEIMSVRAELIEGKRFKSVGVCCDDTGQRLALFVWPGNKAAFRLL